MEYYDSVGGPVALVGALFGVILVVFLVTVIVYVACSIALMYIFYKSGREKWKAWVPLLNLWTLFGIVELPGWLSLIVLIPGLNALFFVVTIIMNYRLPLCFEKEKLWSILCIFFPMVIWFILAFDSSEYCGYADRNY